MAKVTGHYSVGTRVLCFLGGIFMGYMTLVALSSIGRNDTAEIGAIFFGLCSIGGFYGAFVGKKTL